MRIFPAVAFFILILCAAGVGLGAEPAAAGPIEAPPISDIDDPEDADPSAVPAIATPSPTPAVPAESPTNPAELATVPTALPADPPASSVEPASGAPAPPFMAPTAPDGSGVSGGAGETGVTAPRTRAVDITGTYHAEQGLFEQNFANKFFYTDIENGGMTGSSVYIELPAGIGVRMERDGVAVSFVNRMNITDPGAYALNLSFTDDQGVNVTGVFRFRIAGPDEIAPGYGSTDLAVPDDDMMTDDEISALIDSYLYGGSDSGETASGGGRVLTGNGIYTGLDELYDSRAGMFLETTVSGRSFFSSIPNGAVVDFPVAFTFPAQFGEISVTRNDTTYPYIPGGTVGDDGAYRMTFGAGDFITGAAASTPPPSFNFRIVTQPAADLDIYNAPWGFSVTRAVRDGAPVNYRGDVVMMEEDGLYTFELASEYAEVSGLTVAFQRDTTAPEFRLNGVEGGKSTGLEVTVEYLSEDVSFAQLFKDGEEIRFFMDGVITEPGRYYLVVYDQAGNDSSAGFEMLYRLDSVSISLIFGIAGLLALLMILVLIRGRRDLRVR